MGVKLLGGMWFMYDEISAYWHCIEMCVAWFISQCFRPVVKSLKRPCHSPRSQKQNGFLLVKLMSKQILSFLYAIVNTLALLSIKRRRTGTSVVVNSISTGSAIQTGTTGTLVKILKINTLICVLINQPPCLLAIASELINISGDNSKDNPKNSVALETNFFHGVHSFLN